MASGVRRDQQADSYRRAPGWREDPVIGRVVGRIRDRVGNRHEGHAPSSRERLDPHCSRTWELRCRLRALGIGELIEPQTRRSPRCGRPGASLSLTTEASHSRAIDRYRSRIRHEMAKPPGDRKPGGFRREKPPDHRLQHTAGRDETPTGNGEAPGGSNRGLPCLSQSSRIPAVSLHQEVPIRAPGS